jgi:hypothetical protein
LYKIKSEVESAAEKAAEAAKDAGPADANTVDAEFKETK